MSARAVLRAIPRASAAVERPRAASRTARLTVRPANPSDVTPLTFFFDAILRRDYFMKRGQLADIVKNSRHSVFVAEIDGVLVGVAIVSSGSRLINALIHPAYRGLGIGAALVESSGATEVRAKLDMSTGDPRGFYQALGFESTGERNDKGNIELMRLAKRGDRAAGSNERGAK